MGFDQRALQLLLNVVVITGITSLTSMWVLRRRDQQRVSAELRLRQATSLGTQVQKEKAPAADEVTCAPILNTLPGGNPDIRQYVARRSRDWTVAAKASGELG